MNLEQRFNEIKEKQEETWVRPENDPQYEISDEEFAEYCKVRRDTVELYNNIDSEKLEEEISPSGNFVLRIFPLSTKPGCWNYSLGIIKSVNDNKVIAEIKRNYSFSHSWAMKDGDEYLITAEDYQGLTVVNCTQGWMKSWIPRCAVKGRGFCFARAEISPNGKYLLINGCYWGHQYELRIYDFSTPEQLPYKCLAYVADECLDSYFNLSGKWTDNSYILTVKVDEIAHKKLAKDIHSTKKYSQKDSSTTWEEFTAQTENEFKSLNCDQLKVYQEAADKENRTMYELGIEELCDYLQDNLNTDHWSFFAETNEIKIIYKL